MTLRDPCWRSRIPGWMNNGSDSNKWNRFQRNFNSTYITKESPTTLALVYAACKGFDVPCRRPTLGPVTSPLVPHVLAGWRAYLNSLLKELWLAEPLPLSQYMSEILRGEAQKCGYQLANHDSRPISSLPVNKKNNQGNKLRAIE